MQWLFLLKYDHLDADTIDIGLNDKYFVESRHGEDRGGDHSELKLLKSIGR